MARDLEARVAALESVTARRLYGGSEEEALKKWQEEFFPSAPLEPAFSSPEPAGNRTAHQSKATLHKK